MIYKKKNDYSCVVFSESGYLVKLEYVHNIYKLVIWLNNSQKYKHWYYLNVYNRRTKQYIKRQYRNDYIEPYPK